MDHRAAGFESQRAGLLIDLNEMTGSCTYLQPQVHCMWSKRLPKNLGVLLGPDRHRAQVRGQVWNVVGFKLDVIVVLTSQVREIGLISLFL